MRALILVTAVALASCGGDGASNNVAVAEDSSGDDVTVVNDATAIDAATGAAADMAADVDFTFNEAEMNELAGEVDGNDAASNAAGNRL